MKIAPTDWRNALSLQRKNAGSSGGRGNAGRRVDGMRLTSLNHFLNDKPNRRQSLNPPGEGEQLLHVRGAGSALQQPGRNP
jgi:hypothetical protein